MISGDSPWMYHLSNIIFHILNSLLLFTLLKEISFNKLQSLVGALVFSIHPALVQAVVWIPGRNDTILSIFFLLSIITFLRYIKNKKIKYLLLHLTSIFLALLSKELGIVLFVILSLVHVLYKKNSIFLHIKNGMGYLLLWVIPLIGWYILRDNAIIPGEIASHKALINIDILNIINLFFDHIGKIVFPINLDTIDTIQNLSVIPGIIGNILMFLIIYIYRKIIEYKKILLGISILLITILPGILVADKYILESRLYLPVIGFIILLTELLRNIFKNKKHIEITLGLSGLIIFTLLFQIVTTIPVYKNKDTFWTQVVVDLPDAPELEINYGYLLYKEGKLEKALQVYNIALNKYPKEEAVHNNIGIIYEERGEYSLAETEFLKELEINIDSEKAHLNLASLYHRLEKYDLCVHHYEEAVRINPKNDLARMSLNKLKIMMGKAL